MAKPSKIQNICLDIFDLLHFNDVLVNRFFTPDDINWLRAIDGKLNQEIENLTITGINAEIIKHYVLCTLEMHLGVDDNFLTKSANVINQMSEKSKTELTQSHGTILPEKIQVSKNDEEIHNRVTTSELCSSLAILSIIMEQNDVDKELVTNLSFKILDDTTLKIQDAPPSVKYRLTQRILAFEHELSSLLFYKKIIMMDLVDTKKHHHKNNELERSPYVNQVFVRACLLVEFEILREFMGRNLVLDSKGITIPVPDKTLSEKKRAELGQNYKKMIDFFFLDKKRRSFIISNPYQNPAKITIEQFLKNSSNYFNRVKIFSKNKGRLLGILGAHLMDLEKSCSLEEGKQIPLYSEINNNGSASHRAAVFLSQLGFSISARNLYLCHKKLNATDYKQICFYSHNLSQLTFNLPWHYEDTFYLSALNYSP